MSKPLRVLMVEDSEGDALLLIRELKKGGYEPEYERVETAETISAALRQKPWDVILCDYRMPQFNGLAAIALLKDTGIDIPLIIVSGTIGEETAVECMRLGARDYIMKDNLSRLVPAIKRELKEAESRTQRKRADEELKNESNMRVALLDNIPSCMALIIKKGTHEIVASNKFAREIGAIPGQTCFKICGMRDDSCPFCLAPELWKTDQIQRLEVEYRGKWYEGIWAPLSEDLYVHYIYDIAERKRTEDKIQKSEERLSDIIFSIADWVWEVDENGVYTYSSQQGTDLFGESQGDIIGKTPFDFMPPDEAKRVAAIFSEIVANRAPIKDLENWNLRRNGERICLLTNAMPILDEEGNLKGYRGVDKDITERKQNEAELKESKELTEAVVENVPLMIFLKEAVELRFVIFNRAGEELLGYDRKVLLGKNNLDLFPPEQAAHFMAKDREVLDGESGILDIPEESILTAKKGTRLLHTKKVCIRGSDGVTKYLLGISEDITERKRAEETLRHEKILYEDLVTTQPSGVYRLRVKLRGDWQAEKWRSMMESTYSVDMASDRFCNILGISHEEFVANPGVVPDMIHPDDQQDFNAKNAQAMTSLTPFTWEGRISRHHQARWVHIESIPRVQDSETVIWTGIVYDVTERKRSEEELLRTLESLRKAVGTTIQVMVSAVEVRDPYTAGHQIRSANLARAIATEMGLPREKIEGIRMAGSIHDIGKLSIPAEILSKPTKLTNIEFSLIKEHSKQGYEMLKDVESPWPLAEIVHQHHERMDGSGYPRNLKGDEILVEARIMAVADVVESMASHRPYRPSLGIEAALEEIEKNKGILYDDAVADACLRLFREKGFQLLS